MPRERLFWLKKPKIRQSWNKFNLYNLSRAVNIIKPHQTFYQQKWYAKSATRAYHGETIREGQWERMFRPRVNTVVPMNAGYLANHDGSEQAAGRGSGLEQAPGGKASRTLSTPYLNMVYAPTERRLDTAIFRALFASSTRQARQFVVHGYVKVNGRTMVYPGYLLNPGDMFQVEPERVLYATGAPKDREERRSSRLARRKPSAKKEADSETTSESSPAASGEAVPNTDPVKELSALRAQVKSIVSETSSPQQKRALRAFQQTINRVMSNPSSSSTTLSDSLDAQLLELTSRLNINTNIATPEKPGAKNSAVLARDERRQFLKALAVARENPVDLSKSYATPWRPRPYMSAFAFVPRYLEVHHKICSAVYLRHPVARPGLGEVPTPFPAEMNQLAFTWYLRRK